ncbi:iron reductase domain protein [Xylariaceae sp. AK1471]|nr:iron reductase domain protein [Xylariaceae sp. AK1471]
MRWNFGLTYAAALLGFASEGLAADTSVVRDAETGFTFSQYGAAYVIGSNIWFRVAIPSPATTPNYDIVLQIVAPNAVGWTGIAWGATMVNNPLTIGWASGSTVVGSVRRTSVRTQPQVYTGATLQILKTGTHTNGTHWQLTMKCSGCSSFVASNNVNKTLNPNGSNRLAFAYSKTKPSSSSPAAMITVHDVANYWDHDFSQAGNIDFDQLVARNA